MGAFNPQESSMNEFPPQNNPQNNQPNNGPSGQSSVIGAVSIGIGSICILLAYKTIAHIASGLAGIMLILFGCLLILFGLIKLCIVRSTADFFMRAKILFLKGYELLKRVVCACSKKCSCPDDKNCTCR